MEATNMIRSFFVYAALVQGVIGGRTILPGKTSTEHVGAESKLPVITTEHGDVYDCVDFYKQPAFDHPLLKNHNYHFDMKPSSRPKEIATDAKDKINRFEPKKIGCPRGTVPIRRRTSESVANEKPSRPDSQTENETPIINRAGTASKIGIGRIYGVSSTMSIEKPAVHYVDSYSSSIISIGDGHEFLHAGWTINQQLYGDSHTRFYIWMHGANASCFNVICPGFVIVNTNFPLGSILDRDSNGGLRNEIKVLIYQEREFGNWWLVGNDDKEIGFWPKHLFNSLSDGGSHVYFGGVAEVPSGRLNYPEMGSGNLPHNDDPTGNAYSRHMTIVNPDNAVVYAADNCDITETLTERYVARNLHMHWYNRKQIWASTLLYGGN